MSESDSRKKGFTKGRSATFSIDGFSFTIGKNWRVIRWWIIDLCFYFCKIYTVIALRSRNRLLFSGCTDRCVDLRMWLQSVWAFQVSTTPRHHGNGSKSWPHSITKRLGGKLLFPGWQTESNGLSLKKRFVFLCSFLENWKTLDVC